MELPDGRSTVLVRDDNIQELAACLTDSRGYAGFQGRRDPIGPAIYGVWNFAATGNASLDGTLLFEGADAAADVTATIGADGSAAIAPDSALSELPTGWTWRGRVTHDCSVFYGELLDF